MKNLDARRGLGLVTQDIMLVSELSEIENLRNLVGCMGFVGLSLLRV